MVVAALLASGKGMRMGTSLPKQFSEINGIPVIIKSARAFLENRRVDSLIVAVSPEDTALAKELFGSYLSTAKPVCFINGGSTRSETLLNILEFMNENGLLENTVLVTHDAVRPFVTQRIIDENIDAAMRYSAVTTTVPAVDTVFESNNGEYITAVPERKTVFHAQTPQTFDAKELYRLCMSYSKQELDSMTDGCSVFMKAGKPVYMVKGEAYNIKLTYPEDMNRAKLIDNTYFADKSEGKN